MRLVLAAMAAVLMLGCAVTSAPTASVAPSASTGSAPARAVVLGAYSAVEAFPPAHFVKPASTAKARPKPAPAPVRPKPRTSRPSTPAPHHDGGSLQRLVCSYGWSCAVASCIVERESRWNPRAYNPSSGAAGLWQWIPGWYRGNFDPFDPVAATAFAWHRYRQSGWSDWYSRRSPCF